MPGVQISASHEVLPRGPEYDRTSTTVVNAYVAPRVTSYLEKLVARLKEGGYRNQLMVMQASGGVMTKEYIEGSPIRVLASGPAGGVIGSAHVGVAKGYPQPAVRRHGRHVLRHVGGAEWRRACGSRLEHAPSLPDRRADGEGRDARRGRRLDLPRQQWRAGSRAGVGRRRARPDLLRPRRYAADRHRRAVDARHPVRGFGVRRRQFLAVARRASTKPSRRSASRWATAPKTPRSIAGASSTPTCRRPCRRTTAGKGIDPEDMVMLAYGGNGPVFAAIQAEDLGIDQGAGAEGIADVLGARHAGRQPEHRRRTLLHRAGEQSRYRETAERCGRSWASAPRNISPTPAFARDNGDGQVPDEHALSRAELGADLRCADQQGSAGLVASSMTASAQRAIEAFNKRHMEEYGHVREGEMPEVTGVRLATYVETPSPVVAQGLQRADRRCQGRQDTPRQSGRWLQGNEHLPRRRAQAGSRSDGAGDHRGDLHHDRGLSGLESARR